jgi:phosphatidate cytidylyltransferase
MHPIFYYIAPYVFISAVGMYWGNRKVTYAVARERWLKFCTYLIIILIVVSAILWNTFIWIAMLIIAVTTLELFYANFFSPGKKHAQFIWVALFFATNCVGFFCFSRAFSPAIQLFIYFQVLIFDAFCQITGQIFGKHALTPNISPAKTVEGLIGGIVFCVLSAILARSWVNVSIATAALIGLITCATAFSGDMLASYYKRVLGIKDYSKLLPGQGGFLDRFDSLILTGAVYFLLLQL